MRKRLSPDARHRIRARVVYNEIIADHEFAKRQLDRALLHAIGAEEALALIAAGQDPLRRTA